MDVIKPPQDLSADEGKIKLFLGGSIEMGKAEDWQARLTDYLSSRSYADQLVIYNPRRDDWDSSWDQDPYDQEGPFREQVLWELRAQTQSDLLVYYFCAGTISPITLLEFGMFHQKQPIVGSSPDYNRFGNVAITCDYMNIPYSRDWERFISSLDARINQKLI